MIDQGFHQPPYFLFFFFISETTALALNASIWSLHKSIRRRMIYHPRHVIIENGRFKYNRNHAHTRTHSTKLYIHVSIGLISIPKQQPTNWLVYRYWSDRSVSSPIRRFNKTSGQSKHKPECFAQKNVEAQRDRVLIGGSPKTIRLMPNS
ncbi:uncharacterized protein F4812DRAFT_194529 [Daldinia caldariorum]|uniref:uncharacterized protein n=1 Tax=Daldinia caldariorum TaxID=326644 RepID=UPI002008A3C6|nr:uncharacterized protein F4812DRAFT_194529 [Daldinia caldariorum]KAI1471823.1 hypothetical protein F4812DRAFT_194529 [Daldinia caldariorum]